MSKFTVIAGILGFSGVMLGAFGAHGLEERLSANAQLENWRTATLYLFVHALALLALTGFGTKSGMGNLQRIAWFWVAGVILFSGSLYVLAVTNFSKLGMISHSLSASSPSFHRIRISSKVSFPRLREC